MKMKFPNYNYKLLNNQYLMSLKQKTTNKKDHTVLNKNYNKNSHLKIKTIKSIYYKLDK